MGKTRDLHRQLGAEIEPFTDLEFSNAGFSSLCDVHIQERCTEEPSNAVPSQLLLFDIIEKLLRRGRAPFLDYEVERRIVGEFGRPWRLAEKPPAPDGAIRYSYPPALVEAHRSFRAFLDPWEGDLAAVPLDPEHPENERRLLHQLVRLFGNRLPNCLHTQVPLEDVLDRHDAEDLRGQRCDFLIWLPNGRALVIEPGDHDDPVTQENDKLRDAAFLRLDPRIGTKRCRNSEIDDESLAEALRRQLGALEAFEYLRVCPEPTAEELAAEYLFLLPFLVARTEWVLNQAFLNGGLASSGRVTVLVKERDLQVTECALFSYIRKIERLSRLYGIPFVWPETHLYLDRNPRYRSSLPDALAGDLDTYGTYVHDAEELGTEAVDLLIDVAIKANILTPPSWVPARYGYAVRNSFHANEVFRVPCNSMPRPIGTDADAGGVLETFLRDVFRKHQLRPGQLPILQSVLAQKPTIGLLPTSAGKSICYQLAGLLTPGTTLVVDPTVSLMEDQVQSLKELYRIDRTYAWHGASETTPEQTQTLLAGTMMLFVAPERFARHSFRNAMDSLKAAEILVNYAVIDEAHYVSMWGHDFRPSYLGLDRNIAAYCSFQGHRPVTVALTGTASQHVLIDLKHVLGIENLDAIIRPKTFDRPELAFSIVRCPNASKPNSLEKVLRMVGARLGVQDVTKGAWGVVFTYVPGEAWELLGQHVGEATDARTVLSANRTKGLRFGIYTGACPSKAIDEHEWDEYKRRTLKAFKRGEIRMLFGNVAVGVGLDNDCLNYIVNYRMPQSLEQYYQQCGRAGRGGQPSECVLIFSDDSPQNTDLWLEGKTQQRGSPWDDLSAATYFHRKNFPGREKDAEGLSAVFKEIVKRKHPPGQRMTVAEREDERTELYLSYLLVLGVIDDYSVTGFKKTTRYHVRRHPLVESFLSSEDTPSLEEHLFAQLQNYLSRYRPTTRDQVRALVAAEQGSGKVSGGLIRALVAFTYDNIEYRRREAIRTMVDYCRQTDPSPERLRGIIRAYFDESEKFTKLLDAMAREPLSSASLRTVLREVNEYGDAEHLYWETRRRLDEQPRSGWRLAWLYARLWLDGAEAGDVPREFRKALHELGDEGTADDSAREIFTAFLSSVARHEEEVDEQAGTSAVIPLLACLFEEAGLRYVESVDALSTREQRRDTFRLALVNLQLGRLLDAIRHQQTA